MAKVTRWRHLLPGLLALGGTLAAALAVLIFARVGALHGDTIRLHTETSTARGVMGGVTDVWLEGKKVGRVVDVRFAPASRDTSRRLVVAFDVLERHARHIRRDSHAQIRTGGSLLGAPVIFISGGTPNAPAVGARDTIPSLPQADTEGMTSQFAISARDFPAIIANIKEINAHMEAAEGTIGALREDGGNVQLSLLRQRAGRLTRSATTGDGTIGRVLSGQLSARIGVARARADSVRQLLASDQVGLGRFRRDSTLLASVSAVRDEVSILRALVGNADGTAGRALHDQAIQAELRQLEVALSSLIEDITKNPLRYVAF